MTAETLWKGATWRSEPEVGDVPDLPGKGPKKGPGLEGRAEGVGGGGGE